MRNQLRFPPLIILVCCLNFCSCSSSLEDFQKEAEGVCRTLVEELQQVETREDLLKSESKLRHLFDELVEVILTARQYQEKHLDEAPALSNSYDERLLEEMMRIYHIEGGREIIERAQREALIRLDGKIK